MTTAKPNALEHVLNLVGKKEAKPAPVGKKKKKAKNPAKAKAKKAPKAKKPRKAKKAAKK